VTLSCLEELSFLARLFLAAVILLGLSRVSANEEAAQDILALEPIVVTGTRIPSPELVTSAPMTVIDRADIERMGTTGLGEFLQELPMMSGSPTSSGRNYDTRLGHADGSVAVDLRGLGANRTLVLVNGHRLPTLQNDVSVIPVAMVERVEILKSGASAIYGADAVAGVVNIITRQDFEGATLNLQTGGSFDLDGRNSAGSLTWGRNFTQSNLVIGVEYDEQKPIFAADYKQPWLRTDLSVIDPDEFRKYGFSGGPWEDLDGNGIEGWGDVGSSYIPYGGFDLRLLDPAARFWTVCQGSHGGGSLPSDYGPAGAASCGPGSYNYAETYYVQTPYKRRSVFFQTNYSFSRNTEVYLNGRFSNRRSEQNLAPQIYDSLAFPSYDSIEPGAAISKDNFYNPFGVDILRWRRRLVEAGQRRFKRDVDQWQFVAGARGKFIENWVWDLSYNHGSRRRSDLRYGELDATKLPDVLGPSFQDPATGDVICGTPEAPIPDCVSLNAFSNPDTNPITPEMLDWLEIPLREKYETTTREVNLTLTGDVASLSAGPLSGALGFERRRESYARVPDEENIDKSTDEDWGLSVKGSYSVNSIFAELNVPLISGKPGAARLELDFSGRYDDYSTGDSEPSWRAALRWRLVRDLTLRATAGTVFREPNVEELYASRSLDIVLANDPCSGIGGTSGAVPGSGECEDVPPDYFQYDQETRVIEGGNAELKAEEGHSYTAGLSWLPDFLPGFNATLDWWRIEVDDAIGQPDASIVLSGCFSGAIAAFCDRISRFGPESDNWGALDQVEVFTQNVGPQIAEGIDWSAAYASDSAIGLWRFSWFGTWNLERKSLVLKDTNADGIAEAALTNLTGRFEHRSLTQPSAYPEWRWRFVLDWTLRHWGASLSMDYIGKLTECGTPWADTYWLTVYCPDDPQIVAINPEETYFGTPLIDHTWENTVGATWYFDLAVHYLIPVWETRLTAGITNLTDEPLPFFQQGSTASTDGDTFRTFGRSWFLNLRLGF